MHPLLCSSLIIRGKGTQVITSAESTSFYVGLLNWFLYLSLSYTTLKNQSLV